MVGIYSDDFIEFLKTNLRDLKVTNSNIICRCPWCEIDSHKSHFHLYISLDTPIFHCFNKDCSKKKGTVPKLIEKISGTDISEQFFTQTAIKSKFERVRPIIKEIQYPEIDQYRFSGKVDYLRTRIDFSEYDVLKLPGLIFDFIEFIKINNIRPNESTLKLLPILQDRFIGFSSDKSGIVVCRNIDPECKNFRYFKFKVNDVLMVDYYRLPGNNPDSNLVILGEGIFDILSESIFNYTGLKENAKLYSACLSTGYENLIKSLVFYEQLYKLDVHIISDDNISIPFYEKIKTNLSHVIDTMTVYYNKNGKDFGTNPVIVEKFIISGQNRGKKYVKGKRLR